MYLKRLELQGFKSFPDKLALDFDNVITVIVGPNGSGKSNVGDAVRWVLGEQSVKSLRGKKWEDVIFSGTQSRRPMNFAEVSMVLDNSARELGSDYTEVVVSRKVYRSGENEYRINGRNARLRDVRELFMDTGIGKEGYSIIGQGRIDEILNSKSDERRMIFEEASGIVKYKSRRQEALHKLENEKKNLCRINDIISEIEGNLIPLEEQAATARKYMALSERLKQYDVNIFIHEEKRLRDEVDKIEAIIFGNQQQLAETNEAIARQTAETAAYEQQLAMLVQQVEALKAQVYENRTQRDQSANSIKLSEAEIAHAFSDIERLQREIAGQEEKRQANSNQMKLLEARKSRELMTLAANEKMQAQVQEELERLNDLLQVSEQEIEQYKNNIIETIRKASEVKSAVTRLSSFREQAESRKEQLDALGIKTNSLIAEKDMLIGAITEQSDEAKKQLLAFDAKKEEYQALKNTLNDKNAALTREFEQTNKDLIKSKERFRVLSAMAQEYEGFYRSVKEVLKASAKGGLSGIEGVVGEILSVRKEYEIALEVALGGAIQNIVARDEAAAKSAIDFLKKNNYGRATFLPLTTMKQSKAVDAKVLAFEGIVGTAKNIATYDLRYEPVMNNLLERVVIAKDMSAAIAFSKKNHYAYKVVTLQGELISTQGSMTGGSMNDKRTNVFSRNREIGELAQRQEQLKAEGEKQQQALAECNRALAQTKEHLETFYRKIEDARVLVGSLAQRLETEANERTLLLERQATDTRELAELEKQLAQLGESIGEKNTLLDAIEQEGKSIEDQISEKQTLNQSDKALRDKKFTDSANLRIKGNELQSAILAMDNDRQRLEAEQESIEENIQIAESSIQSARKKISRLREKMAALTAEIEQLQGDCRQYEEAIVKGEESKRSIGEKNVQLRQKNKAHEQLVNELNTQNIRAESRRERLEEDMQRIFDDMWQRYEMTLKEAHTYPRLEEPLSKMQKSARELNAEIRALGPVNVGAIDQHQQAKTRYEFLQTQRADILDAEQKLGGIIEELTSLMETTFQAQFKIISANFNEVFKEMFGGGKAYLEMSDASNPLESGIEIVAELPGKKLQSISLLSGGEKALTAIALLFGILKLKPSPFCILDEIEAALDDANIKRFADYLKKLQDNTQFIVVTHRKGTMEAANVIYGVTMEEQGVSKLLSLNLEDAVS